MTTSRTNLCINPSFETNATNWAGVVSSAAVASTALAYVGTTSLLVTSNGTTGFGCEYLPAGVRTAVTTGVTYTFSMYVRAGTSTVQFAAQIQWFTVNTGGTQLSASVGTTTTVSSGAWTRVTVTGTAPATATFARVAILSTTAPTAGHTTYFDAALWEVAGSALPYFDGASADASFISYVLAWSGTAHASSSTVTVYATTIASFTAVLSGDGRGFDVTISAPDFTTFTLTRQVTGGGPSSVVRGAKGAALDGLGAAYLKDVEVPQNTSVQYLLTVTRTTAAYTVTSTWVVATGQVNLGGNVVFNLARSSSPTVVKVNDYSQLKHDVGSDTIWVDGRPDPVVVSGTRRLPSSTLTLLALSNAEYEAILDVISSGITCFCPAAPGAFGIPGGLVYLSVGELSERRMTMQSGEPARLLQMQVQEIAPPPADFIPQTAVNWTTVIASGITWDALALQTWDQVAY